MSLDPTTREVERLRKLERLISLGVIDPKCPGCAEKLRDPDAMAPSHEPSERCESGKRPHCSCDACF